MNKKIDFRKTRFFNQILKIKQIKKFCFYITLFFFFQQLIIVQAKDKISVTQNDSYGIIKTQIIDKPKPIELSVITNPLQERIKNENSIAHNSIIQEYKSKFLGTEVIVSGKVIDVRMCSFGDSGTSTNKYKNNECFKAILGSESEFGFIAIYYPVTLLNSKLVMDTLSKGNNVRFICKISDLSRFYTHCEM